ncbi:betaine--homocysteine S-methyltransferase 1 [Trichonephila clavipes]|nr:betaine--homocysteine S-methyltransferase 1 [Trichonephila clavipes]
MSFSVLFLSSVTALGPCVLAGTCNDTPDKPTELGVRYIGGCCGVESIISEPSPGSWPRRGARGPSSEKHDPWGEGLKMHTKPWVRARARRSYWENLSQATGRHLQRCLFEAGQLGCDSRI